MDRDDEFFQALHEKTQGRLAGDVPLSEFRLVGGPFNTEDGQPGIGQGYLLVPRACQSEAEWIQAGIEEQDRIAASRSIPPPGPSAQEDVPEPRLEAEAEHPDAGISRAPASSSPISLGAVLRGHQF